MRKLPVILLLGIFAFNNSGYLPLVSWLEDRTREKLEISFDKNEYNPADEIVLMVPITHLSYYNSSFEFERRDGAIDINGSSYKFVKMRLHADSVEIICIPDSAAIQSSALRDHFAKWNTGAAQDQNSKTGNYIAVYKIIATEYDASNQNSLPGNPWILLSKKIFCFLSKCSSSSSPVIENPPETRC